MRMRMRMRMKTRVTMTSRSKSLLRSILADPVLREELFVGVIIATQARESVVTTREQATRAYRKVQKELRR